MAIVHGKDTYVSLDSDDISQYTNNTEPEYGADEHDVTCYGVDDHVFGGGLGTGKITISGVYNSAAGGPRGVIKPLIGTVVAFVFRPEGTGTGKPEDTMNVLVKSYKETLPVADYIMWSAELTRSGGVTSTTQS